VTVPHCVAVRCSRFSGGPRWCWPRRIRLPSAAGGGDGASAVEYRRLPEGERSASPEPGQFLFVGFPVAWLLIGGDLIAGGLSSLVSGHPLLPDLLRIVIPVVIASVYVQNLVTGPAKVQREIADCVMNSTRSSTRRPTSRTTGLMRGSAWVP
jgi:hypothetical protein